MKLHWLWLLLTIAAGCSADPPPVPLPPAEFAQQVAAVQAGEQTGITLEQTPLLDEGVKSLQELKAITTLCIDHPASRITADGITALAELPKLSHLRIRGSGIDDDAVAGIAQLKSLKILNLPRGEFTARGLEELTALPDLEMFRFSSPHISDADIPLLGKFPSLLRLHLIDVPITDAGLAELAKIERLQSLYIDGGNISDAAWEDLLRRRPRLHVHINQQHHDRDPKKHAH
jgi:hypothetical protein